jgi:hypothetical protein
MPKLQIGFNLGKTSESMYHCLSKNHTSRRISLIATFWSSETDSKTRMMWSVLPSFKLLVVCLLFQAGRTSTLLRFPPTNSRFQQDTGDSSDTQTVPLPSEKFDVLVYGANAAGVAAAVTASSGGRFHVKVVEPLKMIGGMAAAGGVSLMNQGRCGLTGLAKNWSILVGEYYGLSDGMPYPPFPRRCAVFGYRF